MANVAIKIISAVQLTLQYSTQAFTRVQLVQPLLPPAFIAANDEAGGGRG